MTAADVPHDDPLAGLTTFALQPWLAVAFDRGGGPGGQNVNKVNTRVTLLFDFEACALLADWQKALIRTRLAGRMSHDGRVRIVAQNDRSQHANRAAAEERLIELLRRACHREKKRRATRPTLGSRRRRMDEKRARGATKARRRGTPEE